MTDYKSHSQARIEKAQFSFTLTAACDQDMTGDELFIGAQSFDNFNHKKLIKVLPYNVFLNERHAYSTCSIMQRSTVAIP